MTTERFPLRAPSATYWGILLFGGAAIFFASELGTDRGLVINGIIHLGVTGARVFFGMLALFSVGFVVVAALGIAALRGDRLAVELGDDEIVMPGSPLRPRTRAFRYSDVTSATLRTVSRQELLQLVDANSKSSLARSHVGDAAFDKIVRHVAARVPAPRAQLPMAKLRTP
ncbi:MAG: hypothetical protein ABJE66_26075 [Deltaproteobacteria bacterium]